MEGEDKANREMTNFSVKSLVFEVLKKNGDSANVAKTP